MVFPRIPVGTGQAEQVGQPVQFDHRHHVQDDLTGPPLLPHDRRKGGERRDPAHRVPPQLPRAGLNKSPLLDLVRASWSSNRPIEWVRVHRVPDFVYFDHSIHVNKGVGCVECHGRVDLMPTIEQVAPPTMGWVPRSSPRTRTCASARSLEEITNMTWSPRATASRLGRSWRNGTT